MWKRFIGVLLIYIIILEQIILYHVRVGNFQIPIIIRTFSNCSSILHCTIRHLHSPPRELLLIFRVFLLIESIECLTWLTNPKQKYIKPSPSTGQLTQSHTHINEKIRIIIDMEISMFQSSVKICMYIYWKTVYTIPFENRGENELCARLGMYVGISPLDGTVQCYFHPL